MQQENKAHTPKCGTRMSKSQLTGSHKSLSASRRRKNTWWEKSAQFESASKVNCAIRVTRNKKKCVFIAWTELCVVFVQISAPIKQRHNPNDCNLQTAGTAKRQPQHAMLNNLQSFWTFQISGKQSIFRNCHLFQDYEESLHVGSLIRKSNICSSGAVILPSTYEKLKTVTRQEEDFLFIHLLSCEFLCFQCSNPLEDYFVYRPSWNPLFWFIFVFCHSVDIFQMEGWRVFRKLLLIGCSNVKSIYIGTNIYINDFICTPVESVSIL